MSSRNDYTLLFYQAYPALHRPSFLLLFLCAEFLKFFFILFLKFQLDRYFLFNLLVFNDTHNLGLVCYVHIALIVAEVVTAS
jgi:hypothetical protein